MISATTFPVIGDAHEFAKQAVDFREMAEDLRDSNDGEIFGVDDDFAAGRSHPIAARAEEGERVACP